MIARWPAFLFALLMPCLGCSGDTGTYRIDDYGVRLSPHSDGRVTVEYQQKWSVTGGHIPWITVGVPNSHFAIGKGGGAARSLSNASEGGWSGVRIDLDRDYLPGETFEVSFSIEQSGLFHATGENLELDFTPGWYDRTGIGQLTVTMNIAAQASEVKASPPPTKVEGQEITWVRQHLGAGQQVRFSAAFPKARMPGVVASENSPVPGESAPALGIDPFTVFLIILAIVVVLSWVSSRKRPGRAGSGWYSRGGTIYYGGLGGGGSSRGSSGGGGFGGASASCACACVSCACACACAGGGGAGCAKKATHSCPLCNGGRGVVA